MMPISPRTISHISHIRTQQLAKNLSQPFVFVLSRVNPRNSRAAEVAAQLVEYGQVCASHIKYRSLHEGATDAGRTALDYSRSAGGAAREELAALWAEIKEQANVH